MCVSVASSCTASFLCVFAISFCNPSLLRSSHKPTPVCTAKRTSSTIRSVVRRRIIALFSPSTRKKTSTRTMEGIASTRTNIPRTRKAMTCHSCAERTAWPGPPVSGRKTLPAKKSALVQRINPANVRRIRGPKAATRWDPMSSLPPGDIVRTYANPRVSATARSSA